MNEESIFTEIEFVPDGALSREEVIRRVQEAIHGLPGCEIEETEGRSIKVRMPKEYIGKVVIACEGSDAKLSAQMSLD